MFQIMDRLFISDWPEAQQADPNEFVRVTVAIDSPFKGEEFFPLVDGRRSENRPEYDLAVERISELLAEGKKVICHCVVGRSRSAAVVLGVLMRQMPFVEALRLLLHRHPEADPRLSLFEHLLLDNE